MKKQRKNYPKIKIILIHFYALLERIMFFNVPNNILFENMYLFSRIDDLDSFLEF
jgi:hypothetical protein